MTSPSTLPPNVAISFTPLEETNANSGLDMTYIVSISGARRWLRRFIWNSHSKSAITRRPFTIVREPCLRAKSTTSSLKTSTTTFVDVGERVLDERDALLDGERRLLVVRVADDADDDRVEDRGRAADHVDVAQRDGVERAGVDCDDRAAVGHGSQGA